MSSNEIILQVSHLGKSVGSHEVLKDIDNVEVIQLEINGKFRDYNNLILLQNLINALASFIKQYNEYINR